MDKTIDKIGVGKNAGQVTKLELKSSNNGYDVYSDGVYIGHTVETSFSKLWTVEIPGFTDAVYFAKDYKYAADLLDTFYKLKS